MTLDYSGNVGIGTTSPQTELHVKGNNGWGEVRVEGQTFASGHGGSLEFYSEGTALADIYASTDKHLYFRTNGTTERMRITSAGNVGIGTTNPTRKLQITDGEPIMRFNPTTVAGDYRFHAGDGKFYVTPELTGTPTMTYSSGNVGIGTTSPGAKLEIESGVSGSIKLGDLSSYNGISLNGTLDIQNYNLLSRGSDKALYINRPSGNDIFFRENNTDTQLIIKSGGNVGIGTTNPSSLLHLSSNSSTYETNGILSVSGGVNAVFNSTERFIFNIDSNNTQTDRTFDIAANKTGSSGGNLLFRVQENGNVGIGTTNPDAKLHVTDSIRIDTGGAGPSAAPTTGTPTQAQVRTGGDETYYLSEPDTWLMVNIGGTDYVLPAYEA